MIFKVLKQYGLKVLSQVLKSVNVLYFYAFSQMQYLVFPQSLSSLRLVGSEYGKENHINGINGYMWSFSLLDG